MILIRITKKLGMILSEHQKIRIAELAVLMVIGGLLEMCSVSLVIPFMNAVMNPDETMEKWYAVLLCDLFHIQSVRSFLIVTAIILACLYILKNIYLLCEYNIQYRFVYGNMFAMQRRMLDNYIHKPYEYFLKVNSGEIIRVINNDTSNTFVLLSSVLNLFTELVVSGMLIITVFVIAPVITVCMSGLLIFLLLVINRIMKPILRKAGFAYQRASAGMNKWLLQSIQGIKEIKVMGKETYFQSNYDKYGYEYVQAIRINQILGIVPRFFLEAISMSIMFIIVAFLIYRGSALETIVPVLTAVAMAAIRLLPSVNRLSAGIASVTYNEPMLDKLIHDLSEIDETKYAKTLFEKAEDKEDYKIGGIDTIKKDICIKNIYFHYLDTQKDIFSGASMTIRSGETVGIVGSSGAGKTTMIDIILGLLHPQRGQIVVDGIDILANISGWHAQIGYIPQTIFMLNDTIRHNISFGDREEEIDDREIWRALGEASLIEYVKSLPNGIETEIGERGIRLSGGQRQRISIARALYRNPNVLVFDEATSALDNETELEIMEAIHQLQGKKTMIIIAHRLTTIENCDHIYRVEDGKINKVR